MRYEMDAALWIEPHSVAPQADAAGLGVVVHGVSLIRSTPLCWMHRHTGPIP